MKLIVRAIGNSLGVIIPKSTLDEWGVEKGDALELAGRFIRPAGARPHAHQLLDELKRSLAVAVTARCTANEIRAQSLANLHRWKESGAWVLRTTSGRGSWSAATTASSLPRCSDGTTARTACVNHLPTWASCRPRR